MKPHQADDLKADIARLERQISDLKDEMHRDEQGVLRLQRRLDEGRDVLLRLRGHLDRLWELKVARHQGETGAGPAPGPMPGQDRVPVDPPGQSESGYAHPDPLRVQHATEPTEAHRGRAWPEGDPESMPQVGETDTSTSPREAEMAEMAAFLATLKPQRKHFTDLKNGDDGAAAEGFASAVRQVAHRSIALAGGPLDRNAIFDELKLSDVPIPSANARIKVSKILTRDPDLENRRGAGYSLTSRGLKRQLLELRHEFALSQGFDIAATLWRRWDEILREVPHEVALGRPRKVARLKAGSSSMDLASGPWP